MCKKMYSQSHAKYIFNLHIYMYEWIHIRLWASSLGFVIPRIVESLRFLSSSGVIAAFVSCRVSMRGIIPVWNQRVQKRC